MLDPFMGSGSTALAALKAGRRYIGYEIEGGYVRLAEKRIKDFRREYMSAKLFDNQARLAEGET